VNVTVAFEVKPGVSIEGIHSPDSNDPATMLLVGNPVGPSVTPPTGSFEVAIAKDEAVTTVGVVTPATVITTAVSSPMSSSHVAYTESGRTTPAGQALSVFPDVVISSVRVDELHTLVAVTFELG